MLLMNSIIGPAKVKTRKTAVNRGVGLWRIDGERRFNYGAAPHPNRETAGLAAASREESVMLMIFFDE